MFRAGSTRIILTCVLGIVVLLAAVSAVCIGPLRRMQKIDAAKADIDHLEQAGKKYYDDVRGYPPTLENLQVLPGDCPADVWHGPYLEKDVPLDPWGNPYHYASPGTHNLDSFDIWTESPDGEEIGNWPAGAHSVLAGGGAE